MSKRRPSRRLRRLVARAREDYFFLGHTLSEYQKLNGMDDDRLAVFLKCRRETLNRLALCRKPDVDSREFAHDLRRIANFAACDADRLVQLLRYVAALQSLPVENTQTARGFLMAARDRREDGHKGRKKKGTQQGTEEVGDC